MGRRQTDVPPPCVRHKNQSTSKAPLTGINALDCSNQTQAHQFIQDVAECLDLTLEAPSAYAEAIQQLVTTANAKTPTAQPNPRSYQTQQTDYPPLSNEEYAAEVALGLDDKERTLLADASLGNPSVIRHHKSGKRARTLSTDRKASYYNPNDTREFHTWMSAFKNLRDKELIADQVLDSQEQFDLSLLGDTPYELSPLGVLVADAIKQQNQDPHRITQSLASEAKSLLIAAEPDGHLIVMRPESPGVIGVYTGKGSALQRHNDTDDRSQARWKAAVLDLERRELIEAGNRTRTHFTLTDKAYAVIDRLRHTERQ